MRAGGEGIGSGRGEGCGGVGGEAGIAALNRGDCWVCGRHGWARTSTSIIHFVSPCTRNPPPPTPCEDAICRDPGYASEYRYRLDPVKMQKRQTRCPKVFHLADQSMGTWGVLESLDVWFSWLTKAVAFACVPSEKSNTCVETFSAACAVRGEGLFA